MASALFALELVVRTSTSDWPSLNWTDLEPELDRFRCGAWWVCLVDVRIVGVAHGRPGLLRDAGRFLLE